MQNIEAGGAAFKLSLKDELTRDLQSTLSTAVKGVRSAVGEIDREIRALGQSIKSTGKGIAAAGAGMTLFGVGLIGTLSKATVIAGDFAETVNMFEAVFKDQATSVRAWAAEYAKSVGRAESQLLRFLAEAQDTFVPLGFDRQEAAELSKTVTQLAIDLGSFKNIEADEAMRRLLGGIIGNTENLRAFGVVAQEAQIKAQALSLGFDPSNLTAYQKALAILELTIKGTADAQGDAVRTADSFVNSVRKLKSAVSDLLIAIGEPLREAAASIINAIASLVQGIADLLKKFPATSKVAAAAALVLGLFGLALAAVGGAVILLGSQLAKLGLAFVGFKSLGLSMPAVFGKVTKAILGLWASIKQAFAINALRGAFAGLIKIVTSGISLIIKGARLAIVTVGRLIAGPLGVIALLVGAGLKGLELYYRNKERLEKKFANSLEIERVKAVRQSFIDAGQDVPSDLFKTLDVNNARVVSKPPPEIKALTDAQRDLVSEIKAMKTPLETFRERIRAASELLNREEISKEQFDSFARQEYGRLKQSDPTRHAKNALAEQLRTPTETLRKSIADARKLFSDDVQMMGRAIRAAFDQFNASDPARQMAEQLKTPFERYRDTVMRAQQLFSNDPKNLSRAIAAAKETLAASKKDNPNARVADGIRESMKSEVQKIAGDIGKAFELVSSGDLSLQDAKAYAKSLREKFLGGDLDAIKSAPNFQGLATRSASVAANIGKFAPTFDNMESETKAYRKKALTLADETRKELRRLRRKGVVFGA